jgi:hypothetical protein
MTIYIPFEIQGTNRNNFTTTKYTILQSYIVQITHSTTASSQLTGVQECNLQIQRQFSFGDACLVSEYFQHLDFYGP